MKNIIFLIIFLLSIACVSCNFFGKKEKEIEIIPTTIIDTAKSENENSQVSYPGKIKSKSEVNLSFKVDGTIQKIYYKEGDFVRRGDVLAQMDSRDYKMQLLATEAEYNEIKSINERVTELYNRGSATKNDYEKAKYGFEQITAKYNHHKDQLADTKLKIPIDGYVQNIIHQEGEIIGAGMPVITISGNNEWNVVINIPFQVYSQKENFTNCYAILSSNNKIKIPIQAVNLSTHHTSGQSFEMIFKLLEVDTITIASGMTAEVYINQNINKKNYISIPISSIFEIDGISHIWIFTSETEELEARKIEISEIRNNGKAIVANGLEEGEKFVAAGVHSIKKGMKVKPIK
ncbi:MAG: efflux RND transporter periplasmic adaptor subunit [Bacteroidales bacterium]|jgi:RND family efflux transporter MFP subunit|nr:efflux RND transporter periplasmic adaptor subunit [Bacteroidales bacterium]